MRECFIENLFCNVNDAVEKHLLFCEVKFDDKWNTVLIPK